MRAPVSLMAAGAMLAINVPNASASDTNRALLLTNASHIQPAPLYNWWFYIGGNLGYGWDNIDDTTSSLTGDFPQSAISSKANGVFAGWQIGMFNPNFLIGFGLISIQLICREAIASAYSLRDALRLTSRLAGSARCAVGSAMCRTLAFLCDRRCRLGQ